MNTTLNVEFLQVFKKKKDSILNSVSGAHNASLDVPFNDETVSQSSIFDCVLTSWRSSSFPKQQVC